MTLDAEQFRAAMRAWTSGVTVVTAAFEGEQHGMTVSSFTSISLDPPMIVISLHTESHTHALVSRAGAFAVTILSSNQQAISERFAGRLSETESRLEGLETETLVSGAPFLKGGLAYLDCRVTQIIPSGMNTLFIAEVIATRVRTARSYDHTRALVYHDRKYHKLQD
ncbi:MAG: flavin reductase family protein [Acidobacteriia bacterium]|nr:flavin reductase family protein [Terriglobia bacterium]